MTEQVEQPKSLGELKLLVLNRIENLLFQVSAFLYINQGWEALDLLWETFALIPPDIRLKMAEDEQKLEDIRYREMNRIATARFIGPQPVDEIDKSKALIKLANSYRSWIRTVVGKIQKLLYETYLREGYTGDDINEDTPEQRYGEAEE